MKKLTLVIVLNMFFINVFAQTIKDYNATMQLIQKSYNNDKVSSIVKRYDRQMLAALNEEKSKEFFNQLKAENGKLKSFSFEKSGGGNHAYIGVFEQAKKRIILALNDSLQISGMFFQNYVDPISPKMSKKSSTFNVETKEGYIISGTLVMPQAEVEQPNVVLIIAGSGPTDRNGNGLGLGTNAYAMLADSLSEAGIASVRFDKRGIALSQNDVQEKDTKFDDFVTDVISFVKKIKASKKFGEIYIAGHSEGSLIGMIAANKEPIDGLISIAGAAEPAQKLLAKQLSSKNMPGNSLQEALEILKKLEKGEMVTELQNKNLLTLFRESVQPYLISWFSYDPIVEFQKLSCKILIINGDRDVQVADSSAKMLQEANAKAKLFIIPGMNHVLKDVGDDQELAMKSYNAPTIPLSKELSRKIIDFCK